MSHYQKFLLIMIKPVLLIIFTLFFFICNSQNYIEGIIISKTSNKPVGFANIVVKSKENIVAGANSDADGHFMLHIPINIDSLHFEISKIGYSTSDTILFFSESVYDKVKLFLGGINKDNLLFDSQTAIEDLKKGIVQIYHLGLPAFNSNELNRIANKYGFEYNFLTCEVSEILIESVREYNKVVIEYLYIINPKGWQNNLEKEIRTLE